MEDNFNEIIKQMNYEEWRQYKIRKRYEVLIDPHSPIWSFVENGALSLNSDRKFFDLSCDEILRQIEKNQNIFFITIKRRRKVQPGSSEWNTFTEKIDAINKKIVSLSEALDNLYKKGGQ